MDFYDFFKILFGVFLGFCSTQFADIMRIRKEKKDLLKYISIEIDVIIDHICKFSENDMKIFSVTELPSITPLQAIQLGLLPASIAKKIMDVYYSIKQANELRVLAIINEKLGNDSEVGFYASLSKDWLKKSCNILKEIKKDIGTFHII